MVSYTCAIVDYCAPICRPDSVGSTGQVIFDRFHSDCLQKLVIVPRAIAKWTVNLCFIRFVLEGNSWLWFLVLAVRSVNSMCGSLHVTHTDNGVFLPARAPPLSAIYPPFVFPIHTFCRGATAFSVTDLMEEGAPAEPHLSLCMWFPQR